MGIKISEILPKKEISFESLRHKPIAIDASNMLYQFLTSIRQRDGTPLMDSKGRVTSHLVGIFSRLSNLVSRELKLVVVFDGKPPVLKVKEQEERAYRKEIAREKFEQAKQEEDIESMYKYAKQTTRLTREMVIEAKKLISAMGIPVIQAPSEADAQMAFMNEQHDVWATASSDSDCLVHGAPRLITNLTLSQKRRLPSGKVVKTVLEMVELRKALKELKINQDQLIALSILVGTDYNVGGIKGIGPKKALKLVREEKNFDKMFNEFNPDFNWKKIYAIFKSMPIMKNYKLKWGKPDEGLIKKILVDEHDFSEERVNSTLERYETITKGKEQKGLGEFMK